MTIAEAPPPLFKLNAAERYRYARAVDRGYLVDIASATPTASAFSMTCYRLGRPYILASPYRRHWYQIELRFSANNSPTEGALSILNSAAEGCRDAAFREQVPILVSGGTVRGIRPEAVTMLAEGMAKVANDPGLMRDVEARYD